MAHLASETPTTYVALAPMSYPVPRRRVEQVERALAERVAQVAQVARALPASTEEEAKGAAEAAVQELGLLHLVAEGWAEPEALAPMGSLFWSTSNESIYPKSISYLKHLDFSPRRHSCVVKHA